MRGIWKFLISFIIFVAVCAAGIGWFVENEVEKGLKEAIADAKGVKLDYTDCSVSILDHHVTLNGVEATLPGGQTFTADEIRVYAYDQLNPVPYHAAATATGLTIPVTPANFGDLAPGMREIGIDQLEGDATLDYSYAPDTATLTIKKAAMNDASLGHAELSGRIDQLDLLNPRLEQLIGIRIKDAMLTFTDASLMDHLITDWAAKMQSSKDVTVARLTAELGGLAKYAGKQENRAAENVMLGLKRFLADPGTMTVTVAPKEPVPVLYFFMGRDILENLQLLNMKIETDSDDDI